MPSVWPRSRPNDTPSTARTTPSGVGNETRRSRTSRRPGPPGGGPGAGSCGGWPRVRLRRPLTAMSHVTYYILHGTGRQGAQRAVRRACRGRAQRPADAGAALRRRPGLLPPGLAAAAARRAGRHPGAAGLRRRGVAARARAAADPAADRDRAAHRRVLPGRPGALPAARRRAAGAGRRPDRDRAGAGRVPGGGPGPGPAAHVRPARRADGLADPLRPELAGRRQRRGRRRRAADQGRRARRAGHAGSPGCCWTFRTCR